MKANWESWSEKFLLHGRWKGYKSLLVSSIFMTSMDKISTQDKYENALEDNMDLNEKDHKIR